MTDPDGMWDMKLPQRRPVGCDHSWHRYKTPLCLSLCPDCEAMPAISVGRKWDGAPYTRGLEVQALLSRAGRMALDPHSLDVLAATAQGDLDEVDTYVSTMISLKEKGLLVCTGKKSGIFVWKMTTLGEAALAIHCPEVEIERPSEVEVDLVLVDDGGKEHRTRMTLPPGYRISIEAVSEGVDG